MKTNVMKNLIKIKHGNNGKKTLRNSFEIRSGAVEKNKLLKIEERAYWKNQPTTGGIDTKLRKKICREWVKAGGSLKQLAQLGSIKCLQILNNR